MADAQGWTGLPAPGGRRPRLEDVAARAGVSTATVSLVLRGAAGPSAATRERVLAAASELGYRADRTASLLARRRTHLLGVMLDVANPFHAELVTELHEAAEAQGYDLVLSTVTRSRSEQRAVETLVDSRCEALVLLAPDAPPSRLDELARSVPVVVVGRRLGSSTADVVRSAEAEGVREGVDHLVDLGHRDIVFVDGGRGTIAGDRRSGWRAAVRRRGLAATARILPGGHTEQAGAEAARHLLRGGVSRLPTAVMTSNDRAALGVLDTLLRAGVGVPGDVSLVGYDDSTVARLPHVDLTTVSQGSRAQAEQAVAAAVGRLDRGRTEPVDVVVPPRLAVRSTTGPPRDAAGPGSAAG